MTKIAIETERAEYCLVHDRGYRLIGVAKISKGVLVAHERYHTYDLDGRPVKSAGTERCVSVAIPGRGDGNRLPGLLDIVDPTPRTRREAEQIAERCPRHIEVGDASAAVIAALARMEAES